MEKCYTGIPHLPVAPGGGAICGDRTARPKFLEAANLYYTKVPKGKPKMSNLLSTAASSYPPLATKGTVLKSIASRKGARWVI